MRLERDSTHSWTGSSFLDSHLSTLGLNPSKMAGIGVSRLTVQFRHLLETAALGLHLRILLPVIYCFWVSSYSGETSRTGPYCTRMLQWCGCIGIEEFHTKPVHTSLKVTLLVLNGTDF